MLVTDSKIPNISVWSFARQLYRPYLWYIGVLIAVALFWSITEVLLPLTVKLLIDAVLEADRSVVLQAAMWPAIYYVSIEVSHLFIFRLYEYVKLRVEPLVERDTINTLAAYTSQHSTNFFQNNFAGSLGNKINNVSRGIYEVVCLLFDAFLSHIVAFFAAAYMLSTVMPVLGWMTLAWVIFVCTIFLLLGKHLDALSQATSSERSRITGYIVDLFANISAVRTYARRKYEHTRLSEAQGDRIKVDRQQQMLALLLNLIMSVPYVIVVAVSLYLLIRGYQVGDITGGDFAMVLTLQQFVANALWHLSKNITNFIKELGLAKEGLQILAIPLEVEDKEDARALEVRKGQIQFNKVGFNYKGASDLFVDSSITIPAGEKVGLVGHSGAGKSTFINVILRLYDIQSGEVLIDGQNISDVTQDSLREAITMVPQDPVLFHRSLMDNIRYGDFNATDSEVITAAKKANAHEFIQQLPEGYSSLVGERGVKLSGGQRQRIAIARAILKNAPIVFLDEATSSLDSVTEQLVQKAMSNLTEGKTTLVVAHRLSTLRDMDRILVFKQGVIIEDGSHKDLLEQNGHYAELWNSQIDGFI